MAGGRLRRRGLRPVLLLGVALVSAALALTAFGTGLLGENELDSVDMRFDIRGDEPAPEELVVVAIDDVTFGELQLRHPFRRNVHADLIDRLREAGVRTIAYDVQFTEPSEIPADDDALIRAARRAGSAVFATTEVDERGRSGVLGDALARRFARVLDGDASLEFDDDGVLRRFSHALQGLESFAVRAAERYSGRQVEAADFPDEDTLVAFSGGPGSIEEVSFSRVLRGRVDPARLRGRIAVVGATAPSIQDVHATATTGEELMSGPEIQAHAIATVLDDFPLRELPGWLEVVLIVLMSVLVPLAALRLPVLAVTLVALALGAAYFGASVLAFDGGTVLPFVFPLAGLALSLVGSLGASYATSVFERERVRDVLSRIVNDSVADQLMGSDTKLRLGGTEAECTVLFSDVRGFTSYSESQPPARVIEVLNRYHSEMADAILEHGGTLVSYLGDGIMAVFGAPVAQEDHADRALGAACQMLGSKLRNFNDWMREQGHGEGFRMGVGINTGTAMAGNMGSERRFEYTVIGDTVNTASRLESMTKGTPHQLFVAESTRAHLVRDDWELIPVDEMEVRGRQAKVKVWSLDRAS